MAERDSGHHGGPAGLIRETIKHLTEPRVPGALGQEGERDLRGKGRWKAFVSAARDGASR